MRQTQLPGHFENCCYSSTSYNKVQLSQISSDKVKLTSPSLQVLQSQHKDLLIAVAISYSHTILKVCQIMNFCHLVIWVTTRPGEEQAYSHGYLLTQIIIISDLKCTNTVREQEVRSNSLSSNMVAFCNLSLHNLYKISLFSTR